jgi:hypothetical protein
LLAFVQSIVLLGVVYDVAGSAEAMLFMLILGLCCCCDGAAKAGLPMPGLLGAIAGKEELSDVNVVSGVMARLCGFGAVSVELGAGEMGGVDHANVAAGEAFPDRERLAGGREGNDALAQVSPPSMSVPLDCAC